MTLDFEARIDALARRDRLLAVVFTALMWLVLLFVFVVCATMVPNTAIAVVLLVAAILLGAFNTASIIGMVRGYAANKEFVYREDILNLDRAKAQKAREGQ
jgi:hypothetical protein